MKNTPLNLLVFVVLFFYHNAYTQEHLACPKVLDETIQLYLPAHAAKACEYDTYGKCINSFSRIPLLSQRLEYFDTRFRPTGIELLWQSKTPDQNETFIVLRSKDGEQYQAIGEIQSQDYLGGEISFLDNLPLMGNNYYMLKKVEANKTLLSNPLSVYISLGICHLETMDIKNHKDEVNLKYFVDNSGLFQLLVTDTEGHEFARKKVALRTGNNQIKISIPQNGIYFVTLTNGFSSVTNLFVQSQGSEGQRSAVAKKNSTTTIE